MTEYKYNGSDFPYDNIHELSDNPEGLLTKIEDLEGVTPAIIKACSEVGMVTVADYMRRTDSTSFDFNAISAVPGLGPSKASKLHDAVENHMGFRKPEEGLQLEWSDATFNTHQWPEGFKEPLTASIPEEVIQETINRTQPSPDVGHDELDVLGNG